MSHDAGIGKDRLLDFLGTVDTKLRRSITAVAVGGTAMTLLGAKASTLDVDFTVPGEYYGEFQAALSAVPHGFVVQCWHDGAVFVNMLAGDCLERSLPVGPGLRNIRLRALHPADIVATKIGRLDPRDAEDIASCARRFGLGRDEVVERSRKAGPIGREEGYRRNLEAVLRRHWPRGE